MLDTGKNLPARSIVTRILYLNCHCHSAYCTKCPPTIPLSTPVKTSLLTSSQLYLDGASQIPVKKRVSGATGTRDENISYGTAFARVTSEENARKGKGCDIGYALAINSCEGVNNVDACTVTALDAITAFTVPNPNCPSQSRRFFQVWLLLGLPRRADHSAYFGFGKILFMPNLSAVDGSKLRELLEDCQRPFSVQSVVCNRSKTVNATC